MVTNSEAYWLRGDHISSAKVNVYSFDRTEAEGKEQWYLRTRLKIAFERRRFIERFKT